MYPTASVTAHLASTSPALSGAPSFDWLTFFWGGAAGAFLGALIILGIERILDWIISSRKFKKEKNQVTSALRLELNINLSVCNQMLALITQESKSSHTYASFDSTWLDVYISKFLDLTNQDHINLFGKLSGIKKQMLLIKDLEEFLLNYSIAYANRAIPLTPPTVIGRFNSQLKEFVEKLKTSIEELQIP